MMEIGQLQRRLNDWEVRLADYVESVRGAAFEWGSTNCGALVAGAIDAMFRTDISQHMDLLCGNETVARSSSDERITHALLERLGFSPQPNPLLAKRGDVVYAVADGWECCHVVMGRYALSSTPQHGVCFVPLARLLENDVEVLACPH